jgi:hypothetical protein
MLGCPLTNSLSSDAPSYGVEERTNEELRKDEDIVEDLDAAIGAFLKGE